jgi:uncharacterized coiled-coil protein SlyX
MATIDDMIKAGQERLQEIDQQIAQARNVIQQLTLEGNQLMGRLQALQELKQMGASVFEEKSEEEPEEILP